MTAGSILAYIILAPLAGMSGMILLEVLALAISSIIEFDFDSIFLTHNKYIILGSILLAEIIFGVLNVGSYFDHNIGVEKQALVENKRIYDKAVQSEKKACHDADPTYRSPYWADLHSDIGETYKIFLCGDGDGFRHELPPPKCNRYDLNSCK